MSRTVIQMDIKINYAAIPLLVLLLLGNANSTFPGLNVIASRSFFTCPTVNTTCNTKLPTKSKCQVVQPYLTDCSSWMFNTHRPYRYLGSMKLEAYTDYYLDRMYTGINLTLSDIDWSILRIRYQQVQTSLDISLCREFYMVKDINSSDIFFDCWLMFHVFEGCTFFLDYEAIGPPWIDRRKYIFQIPHADNIVNDVKIQDWIPFIYVDLSDVPIVTAKWQHAPPHISVLRYRIRVFKDDFSVENSIWHGPFVVDPDLSYVYNTNNEPGVYHFEVTVEGHYKYCDAGLCRAARSPDIVIEPSSNSRRYFASGLVNSKTLTVVGIGCVVLIPLLVFFLHIWTRRRKPPGGRIKLPVVLVVYTPSRASHVEAVIAFVEYLRNYCAVEALLDRLDVVDTVSKDPFLWCSKAFARADFVMIISSPPKCCSQQDVFRNVDIDSLQLLKSRFLDHCSRPNFFTVLLPYCTIQDIPEEAKHFKRFTLTKDLDKMLWYIHNGGTFPNLFISAWITVGPKLNGGKKDLKSKGVIMLKAMQLAENDLSKPCKCAKLETEQNAEGNENNNEEESNSMPNSAPSQQVNYANEIV